MIHLEGVTKRFGDVTALAGIDLDIAEGEVFVLLGPNGAGKSTLLKCLVGLYQPLSGAITVGGLKRREQHLDICRFTAWLADQPYLGPRFTCRTWLEMVADLYGVEPAPRDRRISDLLGLFDLERSADRVTEALSAGRYKKLAICAAFVTNARLFLMDEPFTGEIDPPGIAALEQVIRDLRDAGGRTFVLSTQLVAEAEKLATRVAFMKEGTLVALGTPAELCERYQAQTLEQALVQATMGDPRAAASGFVASLGRPHGT